MAHCSSCTSNLGTGGRTARMGTGQPQAEETGGPPDGIIGDSIGTGLRRSTYRTYVWPGQRASTITQQLIRRSISTQQWIPAVTNVNLAPAGQYPWALYTGGKFCLVFTVAGSAKYRVLAFQNGGPTHMQVRVGSLLAANVSIGTGKVMDVCVGYDGDVYCIGDLFARQQLVQSFAAAHGRQASECQVIYYGNQAYMCCGGQCVPLPIIGSGRDLTPTMMLAATRRRRRR
jgi:hypothetical protein